jgi:oligoendopeptidase F
MMADCIPRTHASADNSVLGADSPARLGELPEWNLADLYPSMDSPELQRDLDRAADLARASRKNGRAACRRRRSGADRAAWGRQWRSTRLSKTSIGRIASYAGLLYAGDTSDPARAKLYGDVQQKLTDVGSHLLFFALELNRIDDGPSTRRSKRIGGWRTTGLGSWI